MGYLFVQICTVKSIDMKSLLSILISMNLFAFSACSQNSSHKETTDGNSKALIGGRCEGCAAVFESLVPFENLSWMDTLPDFNKPGPKMMINGVVYQADGKTPAPGPALFIFFI